MTDHSCLRRLLACVLAACALFVSACGPTPPNAYVQGSRPLTADEYVSRYAGHSVRFDVTPDKQGKFREIHFAKDGTFQRVDSFQEVIAEGTWAISNSIGDSGNMFLRFASSGVWQGKAFRDSPAFATMYVYVLPDGTASVFSRTGGIAEISRQPKPTPGFKSRARFDAIKRKVASALDS
jgi:hypothetical protein